MKKTLLSITAFLFLLMPSAIVVQAGYGGVSSGLCMHVSSTYGPTFVDVDGGTISINGSSYSVNFTSGITAGANTTMNFYAYVPSGKSVGYIGTVEKGGATGSVVTSPDTGVLIGTVTSGSNPSNPNFVTGGTIKNITSYVSGCTSTQVIPTATQTSPSSSIIRKNLSLGMRGADVITLQNYLIKVGMLKTSATGYFGPATFAAVKEFQRKNNIPTAGVVGPLTRKYINSLITLKQSDQAPITTIQTPTQNLTATDCGSVSSDSIYATSVTTTEQQNYSCFIASASLCNSTKINFTGAGSGLLEIMGKEGNYCKIKLEDKAQGSFSCKYSINDLAFYTKPSGTYGSDDTQVSRAQSIILGVSFKTAGLEGTNSITGKPIDISCVKN